MIPPENTKPVCLRADTGTTILTELNHNVLLGEDEMISMNSSALAAMIAIGDNATEAKTIANLPLTFYRRQIRPRPSVWYGHA